MIAIRKKGMMAGTIIVIKILPGKTKHHDVTNTNQNEL